MRKPPPTTERCCVIVEHPNGINRAYYICKGQDAPTTRQCVRRATHGRYCWQHKKKGEANER
jgi:hypothetical protein